MGGKNSNIGSIVGTVLGFAVGGVGGAAIGGAIGGGIGAEKDMKKAGREAQAQQNSALTAQPISPAPDTSTAPVAGSGTQATADTGGNNQAASAALQKARLNAERQRMQSSGSRSTVLSGKMGG